MIRTVVESALIRPLFNTFNSGNEVGQDTVDVILTVTWGLLVLMLTGGQTALSS
jgi:hypothetical protein